jgi:cyclic lactone autoinducer peptide
MLNFFASILAFVGDVAASAGSQACVFWVIDEAECPESLIK